MILSILHSIKDLNDTFNSLEFSSFLSMEIIYPVNIDGKIMIVEKRTKRSLIQITDNNCRGQNPVRVYGVDLGRSCNYLKICRV